MRIRLPRPQGRSRSFSVSDSGTSANVGRSGLPRVSSLGYVGGMGEKDDQLIALKNRTAENGHPVSPIIFIDGAGRPSASKLK
jgi:hypothetical protein